MNGAIARGAPELARREMIQIKGSTVINSIASWGNSTRTCVSHVSAAATAVGRQRCSCDMLRDDARVSHPSFECNPSFESGG
jgi:hypothetical protein